MKKFAIVLMLVIVSSITAFADSNLTIKGTHSIEGINSGTRTYVLTPKGGEPIKVTEAVNKPFSFELNFKEPGNYEYTLAQEPIVYEGLTQDKTVYTIRVAVDDEIVYVIDGPNGKKDKIEFKDSYKEPVKPTSPKTGDAANITLWITMGLLAGVAIYVTTKFLRKERGNL